MYLTAQRVVSQGTGAEGINAFAHGHGPFIWKGRPPFTPEENPGTLFDSLVDGTVAPPGNRVRSYLDILTPDETPPARIQQAFGYLVASTPPDHLPAETVIGPCWFRFSMDEALSASWRRELGSLFERIASLLVRDAQ